MPNESPGPDALLTPREAVRRLLGQEDTAERRQLAEDAARLYDQGWSIRQVAAKFDCGYGAMHRILRKNGNLRGRDRTYARTYREDDT